jgi:hypothetical protein
MPSPAIECKQTFATLVLFHRGVQNQSAAALFRSPRIGKSLPSYAGSGCVREGAECVCKKQKPSPPGVPVQGRIIWHFSRPNTQERVIWPQENAKAAKEESRTNRRRQMSEPTPMHLVPILRVLRFVAAISRPEHAERY